jgi:hypothetical protein
MVLDDFWYWVAMFMIVGLVVGGAVGVILWWNSKYVPSTVPRPPCDAQRSPRKSTPIIPI